ncbi:MAG: NAD(+)/NADH kinase [Oscillospiraceae bacterium]|nr:NAD(+)/NADH kinase [Oscillospiraceae bacterium]
MKFLLMPNFEKERAVEITSRVCDVLSEMQVTPCMNIEKRPFFDHPLVEYGKFFELLSGADAVIAIGGDGTIIHAAKHASEVGSNVPVAGINTGRLGFLAAFEPDHLEDLKILVTGDYRVEKRMMLRIDLLRKDQDRILYALNDAVISNSAAAKLIDFTILMDSNPITSYRADGMIFATPTGSTAYSLSAGGAIVDPAMDAIVLTPICPHSMFSRSLIFPAEHTFELQLSMRQDCSAFLTIDGVEALPITPDDRIQIRQSHKFAHIIFPKALDFHRIFNKKIMKRGTILEDETTC